MKNETSISENLAHDTGPSLKIGVGGQLLKRVFISKHISLKVPLFLKRQKSVVFSDFPLNAVKMWYNGKKKEGGVGGVPPPQNLKSVLKFKEKKEKKCSVQDGKKRRGGWGGPPPT